MPFVWAKLMLRLIAIGISIGIFALGIWIATFNMAIGFVVMIISLLISSTVYFVIVRVVGYGVRVGHIAVLAETIKTGTLPDNQIAYGKNKVMERIGTAATFFVINKLVDKAVLQLQRTLQSASGLLGAIPGMAKLVAFAEVVLKVALKYVDECCIAWIFYGPPEQSAWKGALDGVTIYVQNWKKVLGGAVKTAILVILSTFVLGVVLAIIFAGLLSFVGGLWSFLALLAGLLVALAIKQAFIDSWVMICMMVTFLEVAPTTEIRVDMYGKLCNLSPAFRDMTNKAKNEIQGDPFNAQQPVGVGSAAAPRAASPARPSRNVFCGQCGAQNPAGTRFCGECGQQV